MTQATRISAPSASTCRRKSDRRLLVAVGALLVGALVLMPAPGLGSGPADKVHVLKKKMADMRLLDSQLANQQQRAQQLARRLRELRRQWVEELRDLNRVLKLTKFDQASKNLRFRNDIELIRTLDGYLSAVEEKIAYFQTGRDRLSYLIQSADDDLRMIATLNDLHIEALTTQISLVVQQYMPEAHTLTLSLDEVKPPPAAEVWHRITSAGR